MLAVDREVLRHQSVRADFDFGLVLDIDRRIAGQPRSHEQRDIVAPRHERPFEKPAARRAAALHEALEAVRIAFLERDPTRHVDPAKQPGGVDAMMDVALVDVAVARRAGAVKDVAVAGAVDRHLGADREPALLALEDNAADPAVFFDDRRRRPGMQYEMHAGTDNQLLAQQLQVLRIDRWRPRDDAVKGRGSFLPIGGGRRVGAAPVGARRAGHRACWQAVDQLGGDPFDDTPAGPVGHAVDPDHEAARRQPTKVVVPLDQDGIGVSARRCDRRSGAGRSAAGDQHVAVAEHRHLSRPLDDGVTWAWPTLGKPAGTEHLGLEEDATVIGRLGGHGAFALLTDFHEIPVIYGARISPLSVLSNGKSPSLWPKGDRSQRLTAVLPKAALQSSGSG